MARSDSARTALLDAAERLFAQSGIAQVSDRKVAEAAGNTNHSAVGYYFGGRAGLLHALISRYLLVLEGPRQAMLQRSESLLDDVRSLVVPITDALAALPQPTWRARFMNQALHDPSAVKLLHGTRDGAPAAADVIRSMVGRLGHLPREVITGRAALMTHIITSTCAEVEERGQRDEQVPSWSVVGDFLCDAIAGMLIAPVSGPTVGVGAGAWSPWGGGAVEQEVIPV